MRGSQFAINKLIDENYNLYARSNRGVSILSGVVKNRDLTLIKELVNKGIDINEHAYGGWWTYSIGPVITEAAERGDLEMVVFLYELGADINIVDKLRRTPMKVALENSHTEIIELLKSWGANE